MHVEYLPKDNESKLAHLVEECGVVMAAVGKSQRFGLLSSNPFPISNPVGELNAEWILRELPDLELAIQLVRGVAEKALGHAQNSEYKNPC